MFNINFSIMIVGVVLFLLTLELIRRKHLREKYALVWIGTFVLVIILSFSGWLLAQAANFLHVYYAPAILFVAGFFFLTLIAMMLSVIVSHQTDRIITLSQNQAIIEARLKKLSKSKTGASK